MKVGVAMWNRLTINIIHSFHNFLSIIPTTRAWYSFNIIFYPGQLWKYTNDKKLINRLYGGDESYLNTYWILPEENAEGYIEASDEVLGVLDLSDPISNVELEARIIPISDEQKWYRGSADKNGWFLLSNPPSGKVLTENHLNYGYFVYIDGNLWQ